MALRIPFRAAPFSLALLGLGLACSPADTDGSGGVGGTPGAGGVITATGGAAAGGTVGAGGVIAPAGGALGTGGVATGGAAAGGAAAGGAAAGGTLGTGGDVGAGGAATGGGDATGGAVGAGGGGAAEFTLTSAELTDGQPMPEAHTCDGGGGQMNWGISPSLEWAGAPAETMSYAFFMIDWTLGIEKQPPDTNGFHSGAWNIPTTITELPLSWTAAANLTGATAVNGGYLGPCPPSGTDTYHLIIMAMPAASYTVSGANGTALVKKAYEELSAQALEIAEIKVTYQQK